MSKRWSYQTIEVKTSMMGLLKAEDIRPNSAARPTGLGTGQHHHPGADAPGDAGVQEGGLTHGRQRPEDV